jgi:hypothetical protein
MEGKNFDFIVLNECGKVDVDYINTPSPQNSPVANHLNKPSPQNSPVNSDVANFLPGSSRPSSLSLASVTKRTKYADPSSGSSPSRSLTKRPAAPGAHQTKVKKSKVNNNK